MKGTPWERELTRAARDVARLQGVRRQLRKRLRECEKELRAASKVLRRLAGAATEQAAPSKCRVGFGLPVGDRPLDE
jgi:hypothetical protein